MRRGGKQHRLSTFGAGLLAIFVIAIGAYLGFTKDIPFTRPFELQARMMRGKSRTSRDRRKP